MDQHKLRQGQGAGRPHSGDGPRPTLEGPNTDDFFTSIPFGSNAHQHPSSSSRIESVDSFANAIAQRFGQSDLLTARLVPESSPSQPRKPLLLPHSSALLPGTVPPSHLSPSSPVSNPHRPPMPSAVSLTSTQPSTSTSVPADIDFPSVSPAQLDVYTSDVSTLILDIRPHAAHAAARIDRSLSLSVPSTLLKRPLFSLAKLAQMLPSTSARSKFSAWTNASRILVYDTDSSFVLTSSNIYGLLRKFRLEGFKGELAWLRGGFQAVWKDQRHLVTSDPPSPDEDDDDPLRANDAASGAGALRARHLPKSAFNTSTTTSGRPSANTALITRAANPFFDTIRQNVELSQGITERIPLCLPRRVRRRIHDLPFRWLQHIARRSAIRELSLGESSGSEDDMPGDDEPNEGAVEEGTEALAMQFYRIELAEQRRLLTVMEHHSRESGLVGSRTPHTATNTLHFNQIKGAFPFSIIAGVEKGSKNRYKHIWPFEHARVRLHDGKHRGSYPGPAPIGHSQGAQAIGPSQDKHADLSSVRVAPEPTRPGMDNTVSALALERPLLRRSSDSSVRSSRTSLSSSGKNSPPSGGDRSKQLPESSKSPVLSSKPGDSIAQGQFSRKSSPPQSAGPSQKTSSMSLRSPAPPQDQPRVHFPSKEADIEPPSHSSPKQGQSPPRVSSIGPASSSKPSRPPSVRSGSSYLSPAPPAGLAMGPATTSSSAGRIRSPFERELTPEDDYVNASYVQPLGTHKRYIATQGPLPATYVDFWTLCWEQNIHVIVMLTREVENAMVKCGTYWTDTTYGPLHLRLVSTSPPASPSDTSENRGFFFALRDPTPSGMQNSKQRHTTIKRVFELSHEQYPNVAPRRLTHFQYLDWPDMNVPEDPRGVLQLIRDVERAVAESSPGPSPSSSTPNSYASDDEDTLAAYFSPGGSRHVGTDKERSLHAWRNPELDPKTGVAKFALGKRSPVLLHCSAGVGRTGGFITVDAVLDGIRRELRKRREMHAQRTAKTMAMDVDEPEPVDAVSKESQDVVSDVGGNTVSGEQPPVDSSKADLGDSKDARRAVNEARVQQVQAEAPIAGTVPLHVSAGADRKKPHRSHHRSHHAKHGRAGGENTDSSGSLVVHVPYASGGEGTVGPADDKMDLDTGDKMELDAKKGGWQSTSTREWAEQVSDQTGTGTMAQTLDDPSSSLPMPMSLSALPSHVPSRDRSPTSGSVSSGPSALNSVDETMSADSGGGSAAGSAGGKATSQLSGGSGGGSGSQRSAAGSGLSGSGSGSGASGAGSGLGSGGSSGVGSGVSGLGSGGSGAASGVDSAGSGIAPPSSSISGNSGSLSGTGSRATTSSSALDPTGFMGLMRQRLQDDSGTSLSNISEGSTRSRTGKPDRLASATHVGSQSPLSSESKSGESRNGGDNEEDNMDIVEQERPRSVPVPFQSLALSSAAGTPSREGSQVRSRDSPPRFRQGGPQSKKEMSPDSPSLRMITRRKHTMSPDRLDNDGSIALDVVAQALEESQKQSPHLGPGSEGSLDSVKGGDSGASADVERSGSGGDGNVLSDGSMGVVSDAKVGGPPGLSSGRTSNTGGDSGLSKDVSMENATLEEPARIPSLKGPQPPTEAAKSSPLQKTDGNQPRMSLPGVPEKSDPPAGFSHPSSGGKLLPSIIEPDQRASGHTMIDYKLPRTLHTDLSPPLLSSYDDPICAVVQDMREQRMSLCQSLRQYVFVHAAVVEGALMLVDEERERYGDSTSSDISPDPMSSGLSSWGGRKADEQEVTKADSWFASAFIPDKVDRERKVVIRDRVQSFPPRKSYAGSPASSNNGGGMRGTVLKPSGSGMSGSAGSRSGGSGLSSRPSHGKRGASPTELPKEDKTGSASLAKRPSTKKRAHSSEDSAAEFDIAGSAVARVGRS